MSISKHYLLNLFFMPTLAFAQGGPPMVTNDTGTPGDRHWKINIAALSSSTSNADVLQAPYFDINYGWGERTQLKAKTGWVNRWARSRSEQSGAGTLLIGAKYRFVDEENAGISISTYPQIQFRDSFSSHDPTLASPGDQYILPIELSKTFGRWNVNPEIGIIRTSGDVNELIYGIVLTYEKTKPWEPLAEVHANSNLTNGGTTTLINLGLRYRLNPWLGILAAAGHTVTTTSDARPELDLYLGTQFTL